jgi:hypothetical protein
MTEQLTRNRLQRWCRVSSDLNLHRDIWGRALLRYLNTGYPPWLHGCVALTGSDAGNVPTKPAIKFPSISRSALAASLGSSGCLSSGAGLNFSTM